MKEKLNLSEIAFKLVLLLFFASFYLLAISFPEKSKSFPQLIALFSLVMIVISLMMDFTRKGTETAEITDVDDTELKVLDEKARKAKKKRFYKAWGIILVAAAAGFLGGFLFTAFFFFLGFALIFGKRENLPKNIFVAVGMTVIIYFSFQWIMDVPLLHGILW